MFHFTSKWTQQLCWCAKIVGDWLICGVFGAECACPPLRTPIPMGKVCISTSKRQPCSSVAKASSTDSLSCSKSFSKNGLRIVTSVIRGDAPSTALRKWPVIRECSGLPSNRLKAKSTVGSIPMATTMYSQIQSQKKRIGSHTFYNHRFQTSNQRHSPAIANSMRVAKKPKRCLSFSFGKGVSNRLSVRDKPKPPSAVRFGRPIPQIWREYFPISTKRFLTPFPGSVEWTDAKKKGSPDRADEPSCSRLASCSK